jgi:hypothetical protein
LQVQTTDIEKKPQKRILKIGQFLVFAEHFQKLFSDKRDGSAAWCHKASFHLS